MKKHLSTGHPGELVLLLTGLATHAHAVQFEIQPRFEGGFAHYELVQEKFDSPDFIGGRPAISIDRIASSSILPFVGGGIAVFADRAYLDFSAQHYFNGSDNPPVGSTNVNRAGTIGNIAPFDSLTSNRGVQDDNMQRTEWAVAAGYSVNELWSVYAGYKQAHTGFDSTLKGEVQTTPLAAPNQPLPVASGTYRANAAREFDYDGPFIGTSLSLPVDKGWFTGALTGNIAVAFLDGQQQLKVTDFRLTNQLGVVVTLDPASPAAPVVGSVIDGDSIGVTLGLTWKGYTPIENLTYSVGVVGYRYSFESAKQASQNLEETLIRSNLNLSYAFDI